MLRPVLRGGRSPLVGIWEEAKSYAGRYDLSFIEILQGELSSPHFKPFVIMIPKGRVLYDYGVVVTHDHRLLGDVSPVLGGISASHPAMFASFLPAAKRLEGALAVLTSTAHQRYYHWMFDILPRLGLLRDAGIEAERYLLNTDTQFQRETAERLGLRGDRLLSPAIGMNLEVERLIVPSLPGPVGVPTARSCAFLRRHFLPETRTRPVRRLYISRRDAETRRVVNEDALVDRLRWFGFESIVLSTLTVEQQAKLFQEAELVVGPHGAAFTNCVFCQPGAGLVEFMPDTYENQCFEVLSKHVGVGYELISARSVSSSIHDQIVDHVAVVSAIERLLAGRQRLIETEHTC